MNERDFPVPSKRQGSRTASKCHDGDAVIHQQSRKRKSEKIITLGIDLAKNVFAVHGIDESGKAMVVRPSVRRDQLPERIATLPSCPIGIEACSGAHHWARLFRQHGHTVRLMAPKFVTP